MRTCLSLLVVFLLNSAAVASSGGSITDTSIEWPSWSQLARVLTLQDYNTRVVVLGTMLLGLESGVIGTYMLLRKRALIGDALSHATLPGIAIAFLIMVSLGGTGKSLPLLLLGASITGLISVVLLIGLTRLTRIKQDAALGITLSVFFAIGISLLSLIQSMQQGSKAGLETFIYGKTASLVYSDAMLIAFTALATLLVTVLLHKEFRLLSFDAEFAATQGWPINLLDLAMMCIVTLVTVIGLQAVGLILVVALLIIPSAAARFWTDRLTSLLLLAGGIGAVSGLLGAAFSALLPRLPAGAVIVVVAAAMFLLSMIFGHRRGLLVRTIEQYRLRRRISRQHVLRAIHEINETQSGAELTSPAAFQTLLDERSWSSTELQRLLRRLQRADLIESRTTTDDVQLTDKGQQEAARLVRNHRLWELYLIEHADIAPSHVDRDADEVEHVLGPTMVRELEAILRERRELPGTPESPHALGAEAAR